MPVDIRPISVSLPSKAFHKINQAKKLSPNHTSVHPLGCAATASEGEALPQHKAAPQNHCVESGEGEKILCSRGAAGRILFSRRGPSLPSLWNTDFAKNAAEIISTVMMFRSVFAIEPPARTGAQAHLPE